MTLLQSFQSFFFHIYAFFASFFDIFTDDFPWMLKRRTKQNHIIPRPLMNEIVSTLDKEIFYAKMLEREPRSSLRPEYYSIDEFVQKYSLFPRPLRMTLLDMAFEDYKEERKERRPRESFYNLSILLINLLIDYEEFKPNENLSHLKDDLFYFMSIKRSRIFNFLIDNLNKNFRKHFVTIQPRDLQYAKVIQQIKHEVAYRPFMVKYYEHEESFNSHSGM